MANVIDINKVKRAMEACQNRQQLNYIAELLSEDGKFNYRYGKTSAITQHMQMLKASTLLQSVCGLQLASGSGCNESSL